MSRALSGAVLLLVGLLPGQPGGFAVSASPQIEGPFVGAPVTPQPRRPVRDLPLRQPVAQPNRDMKPRINPLAGGGAPAPNIPGPADPLLRSGVANNELAPPPLVSFDGTSNLSSVTPPDPIGAVGLTEYVQLVNATFMAVYDKSGNLLHGPVQLNDLWPGGGCANSTGGDPVVVYDVLADRWILAQFRANFADGICVAVSQTSSALGAYDLYEFVFPEFPDYFKIGVWPDAYYVGSNESSYSAYALERTRMLSGLAASFVRFTGETNFLMPAVVNGATPPPDGAPGLFYTFKDDVFHGGSDRLEIFELHVDWTTPTSATFTRIAALDVTPYTYTVCGFFHLNCIPQPLAVQRVDAVSEWPMWPLAYRNFGEHQTLVANFTIDVGGDRAGIRWYEVRNGGAGWSLHQEGTQAPGGEHRWMGSIGMDRFGNMALGHSISGQTGSPSTAVFPSLRYATRPATDPPGTLQAEATLVAGSAPQSGSNRWGDYSAMSVDPADDCTFWYTGEYYTTRGTQWRTRIGSFKLPGCP
ncbi:MAG: hypothetical protein DME04_00375 [Candidatus Rokuibacteriota bacterium]|nr:MAG: hypothetical protein DME04_00375 [Candidatus Rokubacteria bacterium]